MRTLKLTVSYDGTAYCGWQVQTNGPTIQGMLERAFAKLGSPIRVVASGRTDAGVHAHGQVVSCRDESEIPLERMVTCRETFGCRMWSWPRTAFMPSAILSKSDIVTSSKRARFPASFVDDIPGSFEERLMLTP